MNDPIIVFCWYDAEEWEKLKQTAADKDTLDDTYKQWRRNANNALKDIKDQGQRVQKVSIKVEHLGTWCDEEGVENDSQARTRYAVHVAQQRGSKKSTLQA